MIPSAAATSLSAAERALYHQVRPIKLATDFSTAAASLVLLAQHRLWVALAVMWIPSIVVSVWLMRVGDFSVTRASPVGAYLRRYMTSAMQGVRFLGLAAAAIGAWLHAWALVPVGALVIGWGWAGGWVSERLRARLR